MNAGSFTLFKVTFTMRADYKILALMLLAAVVSYVVCDDIDDDEEELSNPYNYNYYGKHVGYSSYGVGRRSGYLGSYHSGYGVGHRGTGYGSSYSYGRRGRYNSYSPVY